MAAARTGSSNHVELVHRPGEAHLVRKLLTLLGCTPKTLEATLSGTTYQSSDDDVLWFSEVPPEQWAFEQWLQAQIDAHGDTAALAFIEKSRVVPQKFAHFGMGLPTLAAWEESIARLRDAEANDPEVDGRIHLALVARPGEEGSTLSLSGGALGATLYQAFLRTDIVSTGLLTLGQAIEIQHMRENDPAYTADTDAHALEAA
jgi:hypothetical protein